MYGGMYMYVDVHVYGNDLSEKALGKLPANLSDLLNARRTI